MELLRQHAKFRPGVRLVGLVLHVVLVVLIPEGAVQGAEFNI